MKFRHPLLSCALLLTISLGWVTASANAAGPANSALAPNVRPRYFPQASRSLRNSVTSGNIAAVSSASFLPGISPGGLVTIFGDNLSDVSGIVVAQTNPLPYVLAGVSVTVNGIDAPLFSVAY